jgi:hypothetical protein
MSKREDTSSFLRERRTSRQLISIQNMSPRVLASPIHIKQAKFLTSIRSMEESCLAKTTRGFLVPIRTSSKIRMED